jgi:hypothetical protein
MGLVNRLKLHYAKEPKKGAPQTLIVKQNSPGFKVLLCEAPLYFFRDA